MNTTIRAFTSDDYAAIVDIFNAAWDGFPTTVEQMQTQDRQARSKPMYRSQRYVSERAGQVIAFGHYDQPARFYQPGVFQVTIFVHPRYQRQGIGSLLYEHILEDLRSLDGRSMWVKLRVNMLSAVQFARKCAFYEDLHIVELHLDVASFDTTLCAQYTANMHTLGIQIKTLQQLQDDTERYHKLYHLMGEVYKDLPATEIPNQLEYDDFLQKTQSLAPDLYFIAIHEDTYVGLSYLVTHEETTLCSQGLTGVKRAYRRQGLASALKARTIMGAKERGYATISTHIDASNVPSLAVNARMGFVEQPSWIVFSKRLKKETKA